MDKTSLQFELSQSQQKYGSTAEAKTAFFVEGLRRDAEAWEKELRDFIDNRLIFMARVLHRTKARFATPWKLSDSFQKRFRISTFVNLYRVKDPTLFEQAGYQPGQSPFTRIVEEYRLRGIEVSNVTDTSKGLCFWIELSFA